MPTASNAGFPVTKPAVVVVAHTAHKTEYFAYLPPHISSSMPAVYVVALTGFENLVTFLAVLTYLRPGQSTTSLFSQNQNSEPLNVVWKVNENSKLSKEATRARKDQKVDRDVTSLIKQHSMGNSNPGIGTKHLEGDIFYLLFEK